MLSADSARRLTRHLTAGSLAILLAACQSSSDPAAMVASGKSYLEKGDHAAAVIQFKNALEKQPNSADARFLLASALEAAGNPIAALVEYRKARDSGYAREAVDGRIAALMIDIGDTAGILKEQNDFRAETPEAKAELRAIVGEALLASGDLKKGEAAFAEALALVPTNSRAIVGRARLQAGRGDLAGARKVLDEVIKRDPSSTGARLLRADLAKALGDRAAALADLDEVVKLRPRHMGARFNVASTLLDSGEREKAEAQLAEMKKVNAGDPRTVFIDALLLFGKGQIQPANDAVQRVLKDLPNFVPALVLGGLLAAQTGGVAQAESLLTRALEGQPRHITARRALAALHLRAGDPKRAQEVLAPALQDAPNNTDLLAVAAEIAIAQGDLARATKLLQQATSKDPKNSAALTRLGELRLRSGDLSAAMQEFERATQANPNDFRGDLAIVAAHMSRRAFDDALKAWPRLEAKQPKNPLTYDIQGQIFAGKRDIPSARAAFEKAVSLQPTYLAAVNRLAALDVAEGKPDAARKRFEDAAKADPKNPRPLLSLGQLMMGTGAAPADVTSAFERATKADSTSIDARVALIGWLLRSGDPRRAVNVAQEAAAAFPDSRQVQQALASAQLAAGETQQAIANLQKQAATGQASPEVHVLLARAQMVNKNPQAAATALRRAVEARPDAINLRRELALTLVAANEPQRALEEVKRIRAAAPAGAQGAAAAALVEGDVMAAQKKWTEAAAAYRQSLAANRNGLTVTRLHQALVAGGKADEAAALAASWRKESPKDEALPAYLSERALNARDYAEAQRLLQPLVAQAPRNPIYLNNLAWASANLGDAKAAEYAQRAVKLDPYNPAVLDTHGWVLMKQGNLQAALPPLEQATRLAPNAAEIRLHYAEVLAKLNRKDDARRELEAIQRLPASPAREQAATLLKTL